MAENCDGAELGWTWAYDRSKRRHKAERHPNLVEATRCCAEVATSSAKTMGTDSKRGRHCTDSLQSNFKMSDTTPECKRQRHAHPITRVHHRFVAWALRPGLSPRATETSPRTPSTETLPTMSMVSSQTSRSRRAMGPARAMGS